MIPKSNSALFVKHVGNTCIGILLAMLLVPIANFLKDAFHLTIFFEALYGCTTNRNLNGKEFFLFVARDPESFYERLQLVYIMQSAPY